MVVAIRRFVGKCSPFPNCFLLRPSSSSFTPSDGNTDKREDAIRLPILPKKSRSAGQPFSFVDYKSVFCKAGKGGDGRVSFLRLKNIEFGGPDGGNGGNGGHVIFQADSKVTDLSQVHSILNAQDGVEGRGDCAHGKCGEHLYVPVPLNTLIKKPSTDELRPSKVTLHELCREGDLFIAARGGAGGHGNAFYVSNLVRKPLKAEEGGQGEEMSYDIEMRIMATAGLVGIPNVGKSTLLRAISRAKPKVAAYPFTTLSPSVGMVQYGDFFQLAVADIPGLVQGAHRNEGLGFSFLRHIVRCECVLFVLDFTQGNLREQYELLQHEMTLYDDELSKKEAAIVINKTDLLDGEKVKSAMVSMFPEQRVFFVSGRHRLGIEPLLMFLREKHERFLKEREAKMEIEREQLMM
ncbi:hypothetical protein niasHT_004983 [Heterodera trifolii]|uniref:Uncharacterized protein n=1 Tax=Heterodera trifolii TaxID=157864 RepID=A0ABD2M1Q3_9BILA